MHLPPKLIPLRRCRSSSIRSDNSRARLKELNWTDTNDVYDTSTDCHDQLIPLTASADTGMPQRPSRPPGRTGRGSHGSTGVWPVVSLRELNELRTSET